MTREEIEVECSRILQKALDASEYDICEAFQRACEKVAPDWTFENCELVDGTLYISALPPQQWISFTITKPEVKEVRHIPDTSCILTSNPPQYYCNDEDGSRNPCYSHHCDWAGWERG